MQERWKRKCFFLLFAFFLTFYLCILVCLRCYVFSAPVLDMTTGPSPWSSPIAVPATIFDMPLLNSLLPYIVDRQFDAELDIAP